MSIADHTRVIYEYLIYHVLSSAPGATVTYEVVEKDTGVPIGSSAPGATVTYGVVEKDTGVPIGPKGSYMGEILDVILNKCAVRGLPPLPSIVVQDYGDTSGTKMPGSGYFVDLAGIARGKNPGGWRIDPGIERWIRKPVPAGFDKDTDRWAYRAMIGEHQQAVWAYQDWPRSL